jgi:hypothetical protein
MLENDKSARISVARKDMDTRLIARYAMRETMGILVMAVALFWSAGRIDWWAAWAAIAVMAAWIMATATGEKTRRASLQRVGAPHCRERHLGPADDRFLRRSRCAGGESRRRCRHGRSRCRALAGAAHGLEV